MKQESIPQACPDCKEKNFPDKIISSIETDQLL
jgi:hypothetical protein